MKFCSIKTKMTINTQTKPNLTENKSKNSANKMPLIKCNIFRLSKYF